MKSKQESVLQNEILAIQREMSCTSAIDEFAKHARLQRRLNKVQEELQSRVNARLSQNVKLNLVITYGAQVLMGLLMLFLIWNYKYTPVIVVPEKWLLPFGSIISWPTDTAGGISITVWIVIAGTAARMATASLKSLK
ncbi:tail-anchored protein insertion receptor WRB isoform X2 [Cryptotermes secundus]|nr:tail-anchored protein insertion receptor WRB isoform X2 [Cryptotermes secundus]